jgi:hypothetical protein
MWTALGIILFIYVVWAVIDLMWGDNSFFGGDE